MREALALARAPAFTSPNPRVGAVVVRDGRVVGRGAYEGPGTPHAETVALEGIDATGSTMFVTLEPCNFYGRTPPCAPAVIGAGVHRVVVAMEDPDERVGGAGLAELRSAGVEVAVGVLEAAARRLNRAFIHQRSTGLPFVVLKLALTLDGRLAASDGSSRWITSSKTRLLVHEERARSDAIMVGAGTVKADDPSLSVQIEAAHQPLRVVVDSRGRIPSSAAVFSSEGGDVIVATTDASNHEVQTSWKEKGAEVLVVGRSPEGTNLSELLIRLGERGCLQVYCEGGPELATSLLKHRLVDRLDLHYGPKMVGAEGRALGDLGVGNIADARLWKMQALQQVDDDVLITVEPAR
jgi:diaminohydroxyphosphoribosylaminopyrimidine deaminase/5-amino-6-(5-phosphoribosylamino)uracil reductase